MKRQPKEVDDIFSQLQPPTIAAQLLECLPSMQKTLQPCMKLGSDSERTT